MSPSVSSSVRLQGRVFASSRLSDDQRQSMFSLLSAHFTGVDRETFDADLAEKNYAIVLEDETGHPRGFSTLAVYSSSAVPGITVVYSGDTIVEREWWGSAALPLTWLRAVREVTPQFDGREVWWLLLTSGFRTYRFLPVFFRSYYPRHDDGVEGGQDLLNALAVERFGARYDPGCGIVRLARPQVLVPELLDVPGGRASDPHVAFFLQRNPGFVRGDELACVAPIADSNLTSAALRIARQL